MNHKTRIFAIVAILGVLFWLPAGAAASTNTSDQAQRARSAAEVLQDFAGMKTTGIPNSLLDKAEGIAVIPHVVSAAFGIGGRWGKGLLTVRRNGRWQPPVYIEITGGSYGFQIGGEATDVVLVFTNRSAVDKILSSKLKLGVDASVAAGPVGRTASAGTTLGFNSAVYSYSRSKGAFAGVALNGAAITIDNDSNHAVYGHGVSAREILAGNVSAQPASMPFLRAVREYTSAAARTGR